MCLRIKAEEVNAFMLYITLCQMMLDLDGHVMLLCEITTKLKKMKWNKPKKKLERSSNLSEMDPLTCQY